MLLGALWLAWRSRGLLASNAGPRHFMASFGRINLFALWIVILLSADPYLRWHWK